MPMRRSESIRRPRDAAAETAIVVAAFVGAILVGGLLAIGLLSLMEWAGMAESGALRETEAIRESSLLDRLHDYGRSVDSAWPGGSASSRSSMHLATASVLVLTASFPYRCFRWVLTVFVERNSDAAITSFE